MKNIFKRKKAPPEEPTVLSFLDCITPGVLKFETDHYISGNTWRCVWALREYPAATDSQALLGRLGDRRGVTLRIVCRLVTPAEENRIIHNATNRNKLERANTNDLRRVITAESNLQDMASLVGALDREHEPLLYCAVYVEVMADSFENLKLLQTSVEADNRQAGAAAATGIPYGEPRRLRRVGAAVPAGTACQLCGQPVSLQLFRQGRS